MNEMNYWQQFFCTGKVEDYLNYRKNRGDEKPDNEKKSVTGKERNYAGFHKSDGDGYKD